MKAKMLPRIRLEGRTNLKDAIPLDTPIHVFIDPSAACNFKCGFCFHSDLRNNHHEIMKWDTFTRTINQLQEFPRKLKAIRLYGFGEPLLNKRLPEMVAYTKDAGVTEFVEFTTNGWWLNPDLNTKLIAAGLDAITISVPGLTDDRILQTCGKNVSFDEYWRNIADFYAKSGDCRVHVKITNKGLGCKGAGFFHAVFGDICDEISIDNVVPIWPGINGELLEKDKNIYFGDIEPVEVCPYIFYHISIHANGDVVSCFTDWEHKNLLGNVNTDTLVNIWHGPKLKQLQLDHLESNKQGICKNCGQLVFGQADNIDNCRKEIRERLI